MQDVADIFTFNKYNYARCCRYISHLINITMQDVADIFTFNKYNYARCCRYIHI